MLVRESVSKRCDVTVSGVPVGVPIFLSWIAQGGSMLSVSRVFSAMLMVGVLLAGGCATVKDPALSGDVSSVDTSKESIGFFTIKVSNSKNKSYQPNVKMVFIWEDKTGDRERYSFKVSEAYSSKENEFNEYVVSFQLKPGKYVMREIFAQSGFFPVIGTFSVPSFKKMEVPNNKIVYFGHIDANVVERGGDDQLRAGPVIPLIDQAVVGASGGTFVIDIQDRYVADSELVRKKFPYLSGKDIENMTLAKWEKPTEAEMQ